MGIRLVFYVAGILAISVGVTGFSDKGMPLTKKKRITGVPANVIGAICIAVGVFIILFPSIPWVRILP